MALDLLTNLRQIPPQPRKKVRGETFADEVRFKIARSTSKTYTRILTKS